MVDHARHRAHDIKRHLGRPDKRPLDRLLLRCKLFRRVLRHAVRRGKGLKRARIGVDKLDQAGAKPLKLLKVMHDFALDLGICLLSHGEAAHHGRERRGERADVCRRPAPAGNGRRGCKLLNETGVYHQSLFLVSSPQTNRAIRVRQPTIVSSMQRLPRALVHRYTSAGPPKRAFLRTAP